MRRSPARERAAAACRGASGGPTPSTAGRAALRPSVDRSTSIGDCLYCLLPMNSDDRRLLVGAMFVDTVGGGLLTPFELVYALKIAHLSLASAGIVLSVASAELATSASSQARVCPGCSSSPASRLACACWSSPMVSASSSRWHWSWLLRRGELRPWPVKKPTTRPGVATDRC